MTEVPENTILLGSLAELVLSNFATEQECVDAILDGSVGELPWSVDAKGETFSAMPICAGHIYCRPKVKGPQPAKVMVIGKLPRPIDVEDPDTVNFIPKCFNSDSHAGQFFLDTCLEFGVDPALWYVTYLFKTLHPEDPNRGSRLKANWLKESFPILQYEITQVAPEYILIFGAEACKALFGNKAKITELSGSVLEYEYTDFEKNARVAKCVACTSPHAVIRSSDTEEAAKYRTAFGLFTNVLTDSVATETVTHHTVRTIQEWRVLKKLIEAECENNLIAIDGEWSGQHPQNSNSQLRTIQISWKDKTAAAVIWSEAELDEAGKVVWVFNEEEQAEIKKDFYEMWMTHIVAGHFLDSDAETLVYYGFIPTIYDLPYIPTSGEEYLKCVKSGTPCLIDTAMMAHAYDETANHSLTGQYMLRCPTVPRYETDLLQWKKDYCRANKIKEKELAGYAPCPDDIIVYYGCYDADVTRRLAVWYIEHLEKDPYGLNCWTAFSNSMQQWPAILEMNCNGVHVDRDRLNDLTDLYKTEAEALESKIKRDVMWPTLNINSSYQLRELLFGEKHNNAKTPGCLRPTGAITLGLTPLYSTDGSIWEKAVKQDGALAVPKADARTLSLLASQFKKEFKKTNDAKAKFTADVLTNLRSVKLLRKALSYVLKDADVDDDGNVTERGLSAFICDDDKLRTHFYCTLDTARFASARPAMQNISKKREADYKKIVGNKYIAPLRSILVAPPGHMLISADFLGAELFACGMLSGDETMLDHVQRNTLAEDDPNFYDIHSSIAVSAFRLNCAPTKVGLESIDKVALRVVAKSIIFGLLYGRGAAAVAEAVKEEGVFVTVEEVKQTMSAVIQTYPKAMQYLQEAAASVYDPGYIVGVDHRYRRKPRHEYLPNDKLAELERVFKNYPFQNLVAESMRRTLKNLCDWRFENDEEFYLCLQVHDEVVISAPYKHVEAVVDKVLPACMNIEWYPRTLQGELDKTRGPYSMGFDCGVGFRYGVKEKNWRKICKEQT